MRVSVCALVFVGVAGCYGTPRTSFPGEGIDGGAGAGGTAGAAGAGIGGSGAAGGTTGTAGGVGDSAGAGGTAGAAGAGIGDGGLDAAPTTCDGASPPAAPRLLRPMRGAYTGSLHAPAAIATLRPTFSWASVTPTCGAVTYEVQADDSCMPGALDACAFASPELDAKAISALSYAPATDLKVSTTAPVGAFYGWRVRACDASSRCGPWSEVRYLHVGRVREDINGDGYGDLLAVSNRGIEVYLGSSQFNVSGPTVTIGYTASGIVPTFSGDVNGDGYGDFFGASAYDPSAGLAPTIFFGGQSAATPTTLVLTKTAGGPSTVMKTTSAGDLNGDGFADLIVQWSYPLTTPMAALRIFFGGSTISNTPDLSIRGPYVDAYTLQNSRRVGDVNGDGFEDIAMTAFDGPSKSGVVQFFAGGMHPTTTPAATVPTTPATYQIEPAGDVDNDGCDDAVFVLAGTNYTLYRGNATLPTTVSKTWTDATASSATGGFDIDRDGFADFIIGTTANAPILLRGGPSGPSLVQSALTHLNASIVVTFSDHDGDGRPDLIGMNTSADSKSIQWAGSDGTTDPRTFIVRLPVDAIFGLVR